MDDSNSRDSRSSREFNNNREAWNSLLYEGPNYNRGDSNSRDAKNSREFRKSREATNGRRRQ
jgi:hypothetical protein